jgi:dihydroneopterin aldolase
VDRITLTGMEFYAYHGVLAEEARIGQKFTVDLSIEADLREAGETDDLSLTLNYADAYQMVQEVMTQERYQLIEAVAERIAARILQGFRRARRVRVKVCKNMPPIEGILGGAAVEIERERIG